MTQPHAADSRPISLVPQEGGVKTPIQRAPAVVFLLAVHILPVVAITKGTRPADWWTLAVVFPFLALAVGTGLHRYFAHHAFRTSRPFQFLLGLATCTTFSDPIGFAGKHRIHHRFSDTEDDVHTPIDGFWACWFGSLVDDGLTSAQVRAATKDLVKFPELLWLHRLFMVPGLTVAAGFFWVGGFSRMAVGYLLGVALLLNLTSSVNYVCHRWGSRRYPTRDASRNNFLIAILTFGEGWHNNHHYYPGTARAGFFWWEWDPNYWLIRFLDTVGLVWNVREVPAHVRKGRQSVKDQRPGVASH